MFSTDALGYMPSPQLTDLIDRRFGTPAGPVGACKRLFHQAASGKLKE
jgi:hypothetical protein